MPVSAFGTYRTLFLDEAKFDLAQRFGHKKSLTNGGFKVVVGVVIGFLFFPLPCTTCRNKNLGFF
jgi:hypothetical protein